MLDDEADGMLATVLAAKARVVDASGLTIADMVGGSSRITMKGALID